MSMNIVYLGDALEKLKDLRDQSVDLIYLDPPFFTNKIHTSSNRERSKRFSFDDLWDDLSEYADFIRVRLIELKRVLKASGSIFVHCDKNANFLIRVLLDEVFGSAQFRSEIIWYYKRWSNSSRGLLPAHQTIYFYSKTSEYKFNKIFNPYSETTNIDQILQLRSRDENGVTKYATNSDGSLIYGTEKKGVPLSDVWEIPYLNPKAKERSGYPTQKPILLLERIIELTTSPGDVVLDPFCGSGTALVAAKILDRNYIGIDISSEAVNLTQARLSNPVKTESELLMKGRAAYANADAEAMTVLNGIPFIPVHRNSGIDAFLQSEFSDSMIPVRVQRKHESLFEAARMLLKATSSKNFKKLFLIRTSESLFGDDLDELPSSVIVIETASFKLTRELAGQMSDSRILKTQ